jgi:hypothetical protein
MKVAKMGQNGAIFFPSKKGVNEGMVETKWEKYSRVSKKLLEGTMHVT